MSRREEEERVRRGVSLMMTKQKLPVGSNSSQVSEGLSLLGFLSGGGSLLRMLLVLEKRNSHEEQVNPPQAGG